MSPLASRSMRSSLTIAAVSAKHSGKYWCSPSQVRIVGGNTQFLNTDANTDHANTKYLDKVSMIWKVAQQIWFLTIHGGGVSEDKK